MARKQTIEVPMRVRPAPPVLLAVPLTVLLAACAAPEAEPREEASPAVRVGADGEAPPAVTAPDEPPVRADINAPYLSARLDVDDLAEGFSAESREVFAARGAVTAALGIAPGDTVADIGAGTGIYLAPFSRAVGPAGEVVAIDISERLVDYLAAYAAEEGLANVRAALGADADTGLAPDSVDLAFTSDVYHHFARPMAMNAHLYEAIRPGGRFAVLDFRKGEGAPAWIARHVRADMAGVIAEVTAAGFAYEGEVAVEGLEDNYLIVFRKPG